MAAAWMAYKAGTLSAADYTAEAKAYTQQYGESAPASCTAPINLTIMHTVVDAGGGGCGGSSGPGIPMNQYPEHPGYYCGPSAGMSLLDAMHKNTSHDGEALSQAQLATRTTTSSSSYAGKYFETDYWGNTPWTSGTTQHPDFPVPSGLDWWIEGTYNGYYIPDPHGTTYGYTQDLTYDIDNGHPLMANTTHNQGDQINLNGHPDRFIQHWVALMGYEDKGAGTDYTDPAANSPDIAWGANVQPQSFGFLSTKMEHLIQPQGVVW